MVKQKWSLLSQNEQRLIIAGGVLVLVFATYFYVWKPYTVLINNYTQRVNELRADIAWLKKIKQQIKQLETQPQQRLAAQASGLSSRSLIDAIDKSIRTNQLADSLEVLKKTGDHQVFLAFKNTEFDNLIQWLINISRQLGVQVVNADIEKTDTRGLVYARLTLAGATQQ